MASLKKAAVLALPLLLCACAGKEPGPRAVALAVDGPALALAGEFAGMPLEGSMDRTCMAGYGNISLAATNGADFSCQSRIDDPPTEKGRVRGVLTCTGGRNLPFSLRNIGPDQGVGVARESGGGPLMTLFYHASKEEAERRFPEVRADIAAAQAGR